MTSSDWPLGALLRQHRVRAGFSKREAAKRAGISEGMWRKLENGYFTVRAGDRYDLVASDPERRGTTPETVVNVARAVELDVDTALVAAGFDPMPAASEVPDEPVDIEARAQFDAFYKTFEKAWGPEVARAAMREAYRRRDAARKISPERTSGATESGIG